MYKVFQFTLSFINWKIYFIIMLKVYFKNHGNVDPNLLSWPIKWKHADYTPVWAIHSILGYYILNETKFFRSMQLKRI